MVGALGGVVLGFAFLRRRSALGIAAAVLALARLRPARRGRPGDHRPLHDARRRRSWRSSSPSPCSAGACSTAATPGAGAGRSSPALVAADVRRLAAEPVGPRLAASTPTSPTRRRIESDLTDLVDAGAFEPALRPDRRPQPPRRPPPRLRPRRQADRRSSAPARKAAPDARLLRRPGQPLRDPQLHPRPQRPDRLRRSTGPAGLPAKSPATSPGASTAAAEPVTALGRQIGGSSKPRRKCSEPTPSQLSFASSGTASGPGSSGTITAKLATSRSAELEFDVDAGRAGRRRAPASSRISLPLAGIGAALRRRGAGAEEALFGESASRRPGR